MAEADLADPNSDVQDLFQHYDLLYFRGGSPTPASSLSGAPCHPAGWGFPVLGYLLSAAAPWVLGSHVRRWLCTACSFAVGGGLFFEEFRGSWSNLLAWENLGAFGCSAFPMMCLAISLILVVVRQWQKVTPSCTLFSHIFGANLLGFYSCLFFFLSFSGNMVSLIMELQNG